ncbi:hypothetical protein BOX15_Mlig027682g2 [Macrostomum lignano]|uniref:Nuclear nucleic acid-binding protein C1D n=1 Tax=Macrostomum lignano TaxID=282301 RepID=A0A267D9U5_9PLAT|nr:hypothetical protein BOX15_Mlig027682g2 [Macrostomum lignano]
MRQPYEERTADMTPLEKAKFDLTFLYGMNALYWVYLRCQGQTLASTAFAPSLTELSDRCVESKLRPTKHASRVSMSTPLSASSKPECAARSARQSAPTSTGTRAGRCCRC